MGHRILLLARFFTVLASAYSKSEQHAASLTNNTYFDCSEEGRFSYPGACWDYVECVSTHDGSFKKRFGSCNGGIFNEEKGHCVEQDENYNCEISSRIVREIKLDIRLRRLCSNIQNGFICSDCKTIVNCIAGEPYSNTCEVGDMCSTRPEYGGAVCYPGLPTSCTCSSKYTFHTDTYNPQMFFYCNDIGDEPEMYQCTEGKRFDNKTKQCTNPEGLPDCTATGEFACQDCKQYYTCIQSKGGWVQKKFTCNNGFMFNEITKICEDPCSWKVKPFTCQKVGIFFDPTSCQHFYECAKHDQGFLQYCGQCPSGTEWKVNYVDGQEDCIGNVANTCRPKPFNTCTIPKERCPDITPSTPSEAPSTTSEAPSTTSEAPSTTSEAPSTTSEAPSTTTKAPSTTSEAPKPCEAPFTRVPGVGCIRYMAYDQTASGARNDCIKENADLYVADSLQELDIFWKYWASKGYDVSNAMRLWFGIINRKWLSGRPVTEWAAGEPKSNTNLCQYAVQGLRITELHCNNKSHFMCERN